MPSRTWQTRNRRRSQNDPKLNHDLGRMDNLCNHCGAFIWKSENKSLCCANGQVTLPPLPPPPLFLQQLFSGTDAKCRTFRDNIRAYNSSLAFASLGVNVEFLPPGVYCFKIHGEVHHSVGPLLPDPTRNERQ